MTTVPQHVVQRGSEGQSCFLRPEDYRWYLHQLLEETQKHGCLVHAYALMSNHVHLLITANIKGAIEASMRSLAHRYVTYFNHTYRRNDPLWEEGYKSCFVDIQSYLLTCYRYIELKPVRATLVADPEQYIWTSYHANALGALDSLIRPHQEYLALGSTPEERQASYRELFRQVIGDQRLKEIREHIELQRTLGTRQFREAVEAELERAARMRLQRRPRRRYSTPYDYW
ncbi:transposase [Dyella flagellata]|nr:transposase [Dyella flagellata]